MKNYLSNRNSGLGFNLFDDLFDDFFKPAFLTNTRNAMQTDIRETDSGYELAVDMPGFDKNDITLNLENGYLTIEAKREEKEQDDKNYLRRERNFTCKRSYYVGEAVTEEDVKAKYLNGTLEIVVPKKKEKEITRKNIAID
jgi:HSP20 family molecular chaperone IbpA